MRAWFILFLFLSLQLSGFNFLSGGYFFPPGETRSVSANKALTVPIGGSDTGEEPGDGTGAEPGYGTLPGTGDGTETGED